MKLGILIISYTFLILYLTFNNSLPIKTPCRSILIWYKKVDTRFSRTSQSYREAICKYGIQQSMNSAGGRCHDNARCESMWARMKSELLYDRYDTEKTTTEEPKTLLWRYFISYWNNRRICSANGGLPPMVKRQQ